MTTLYALAIVAGIGLLAPFVVGGRWRPPRSLAAGVMGFGMAGMSASYAGWGAGLAIAAAVAGGAGLAAVARWASTPKRGGET